MRSSTSCPTRWKRVKNIYNTCSADLWWEGRIYISVSSKVFQPSPGVRCTTSQSLGAFHFYRKISTDNQGEAEGDRSVPPLCGSTSPSAAVSIDITGTLTLQSSWLHHLRLRGCRGIFVGEIPRKKNAHTANISKTASKHFYCLSFICVVSTYFILVYWINHLAHGSLPVLSWLHK